MLYSEKNIRSVYHILVVTNCQVFAYQKKLHTIKTI